MDNSDSEQQQQMSSKGEIDVRKVRYPHCIVWTPIPLLTWIFPFIGHMGVAYTNGVIRDFAGPYFVSEDDMAFGKPTRYWQLDVEKVAASGAAGTGKREMWDRGVYEASEEYKHRMHNLCCDNCHSHVAMALNTMRYNNDTSWNMIKLAFFMMFRGKFVNFVGFLKTWLPFLIMVGIIVTAVVVTHHSVK